MNSVGFNDCSDLENRAKNSLDYHFFKKQLRSIGIYRKKRSNYFSFFIQNPRLEISPNRHFNTSWYLMQNPEARQSTQHPYLNYLDSGFKENRLPNEMISLEEVRTLRIGSIYSPVEVLQERTRSKLYEWLEKSLHEKFLTIKSLCKIIWKTRHDTIQRRKTVSKIFLCVTPGKTYRSAYENYSRMCSAIGNSGPMGRVLKTDAHNESGRYSISIPLTPIISQFAEKLDCIEIDADVIADASLHTKTPQNTEITQSTITQMPFDKGEFDCILDFSTIDHLSLEESKLALREYERVSSSDPLIVIVVWTSAQHRVDQLNSQTYFSRTDFRSNLENVFNVYFEKNLLTVENGTLVLYVCSKRVSHG
jgi:hypothetical protein